jgi:hypothetical protein
MPTDDQLKVREVRDELAEATGPSPSPPAGQLGTFAVLGAAAGTVPLPWLPDALARRVRGALVQDIAARHGLALSRDARTVLSSPSSSKKRNGALAQAFAYLGRKILVRFGPLGVLPPLRAGLETYALGHLFHRYLERGRTETGRLEEREALELTFAIERAVIRVASPERGLEWPTAPSTPEDTRDELTQVVDGLLNATATVPSWLLHRLDLAFDEVLKEPSDARGYR